MHPLFGPTPFSFFLRKCSIGNKMLTDVVFLSVNMMQDSNNPINIQNEFFANTNGQDNLQKNEGNKESILRCNLESENEAIETFLADFVKDAIWETMSSFLNLVYPLLI